MKKMMLMAVIAVSVAFAACAQKMDAAKVPAQVKTSFEKLYPGATPKWEKEDGKYEANFMQGADKISALFEPNGSIAETEIDIKVADLPAIVLAYVKEHYKGKTVKEAAKITKAGGTINYEAEVAGVDVLFDADGKFIKEAKD